MKSEVLLFVKRWLQNVWLYGKEITFSANKYITFDEKPKPTIFSLHFDILKEINSLSEFEIFYLRSTCKHFYNIICSKPLRFTKLISDAEVVVVWDPKTGYERYEYAKNEHMGYYPPFKCARLPTYAKNKSSKYRLWDSKYVCDESEKKSLKYEPKTSDEVRKNMSKRELWYSIFRNKNI